MRVGINGMGRIGRLALRAAMGAAERPEEDPRRGNRLDIVHLNEIKGGATATAHLLEFDSVQGRWRTPIAAEGQSTIRIRDRGLSFSEHPVPAEIPWGELGVDVVLECTGRFLDPGTLEGHLRRGAKRVIVAAPVKFDSVLNALENPSLKSLLVTLYEQANAKLEFTKDTAENRLRVLTHRMGEQQDVVRRQQQITQLEKKELSENDELDMLQDVIRQARLRQGLDQRNSSQAFPAQDAAPRTAQDEQQNDLAEDLPYTEQSSPH